MLNRRKQLTGDCWHSQQLPEQTFRSSDLRRCDFTDCRGAGQSNRRPAGRHHHPPRLCRPDTQRRAGLHRRDGFASFVFLNFAGCNSSNYRGEE